MKTFNFNSIISLIANFDTEQKCIDYLKTISRIEIFLKVITPKQIGDINRTLELYNAMGGSY